MLAARAADHALDLVLLHHDLDTLEGRGGGLAERDREVELLIAVGGHHHPLGLAVNLADVFGARAHVERQAVVEDQIRPRGQALDGQVHVDLGVGRVP